MVDIFSSEKRSQIMRKIGPKDSKQELFVRRLVFSLGYRYRLHRKDLPGSPDIALPKYHKAIFVNGCFWHGHKGCKRSALPATNRAFWKEKIAKNKARDKKNYTLLRKAGWDYMIIWQCEIKKENESILKKKIIDFLT